MDQTPGAVLRNAVDGATIQVPGVPNALAGKLAEREGYSAVYLSGAGFSAGALAVPDVGLFTLDDLAIQARRLCSATSLPVIVDSDTGFGGPEDVLQTVRELESIGVAAVQLEDQDMQKRCGHLAGKTVVTAEEMCEKLKAATEARSDPNLVIIARTDSRGTDDLATAVDRARRYLDAGADWIFPEALRSAHEFARFAKAVDAPLVANMTEFGTGPLLNYNELASMGYVCVLYPVTLLRIANKAMQAALAVIDDEGSQQSLLDLMQTRDELYDLLDYDPESYGKPEDEQGDS